MGKKYIKGFSLFELLLVLAIIGIVASLILPNIGKINNATEQTIAMRNAQMVVSQINNGAAAGVFWGNTKIEAINAVIEGRAPRSGALKGVLFQVVIVYDSSWEYLIVFDHRSQTAKVSLKGDVPSAPVGALRKTKLLLFW
jgi:prepilin-type N-terminal cleavage/methylation domain-containing protein